MGLFRRKSKKDEEEQDSEENVKESGQKKILKKRDFKDLGSENKKARREPKKPWGKIERTWVIVVLLLTIGISGYLWAESLGWQLPKLSKINFKMPVIFSEETIILEKNK